MNEKFDELAMGIAQSVTRRGALKKLGVGLAGAVIASLGLANKAQAGKKCLDHQCFHDCKNGCVPKQVDPVGYQFCVDYCYNACSRNCGI